MMNYYTTKITGQGRLHDAANLFTAPARWAFNGKTYHITNDTIRINDSKMSRTAEIVKKVFGFILLATVLPIIVGLTLKQLAKNAQTLKNQRQCHLLTKTSFNEIKGKEIELLDSINETEKNDCIVAHLFQTLLKVNGWEDLSDEALQKKSLLYHAYKLNTVSIKASSRCLNAVSLWESNLGYKLNDKEISKVIEGYKNFQYFSSFEQLERTIKLLEKHQWGSLRAERPDSPLLQAPKKIVIPECKDVEVTELLDIAKQTDLSSADKRELQNWLESKLPIKSGDTEINIQAKQLTIHYLKAIIQKFNNPASGITDDKKEIFINKLLEASSVCMPTWVHVTGEYAKKLYCKNDTLKNQFKLYIQKVKEDIFLRRQDSQWHVLNDARNTVGKQLGLDVEAVKTDIYSGERGFAYRMELLASFDQTFTLPYLIHGLLTQLEMDAQKNGLHPDLDVELNQMAFIHYQTCSDEEVKEEDFDEDGMYVLKTFYEEKGEKYHFTAEGVILLLEHFGFLTARERHA